MKKRSKQKQKNQKQMLTIIGAIVLLIVGISVAYAALSSTLNITTGSVTQGTMSWEVGFLPGTVEAAVGGTSDTGRSCGDATATASTVTIANSTLSKPDDSCTYQLTIKNTGTLDAVLTNVTPVHPTSTTCTDSGASMECGNLTYKLSTDVAGTTLLPLNGTIAKSTGSKTVYLIVKYTGTEINSTAIEQAAGGFTLVYSQK